MGRVVQFRGGKHREVHDLLPWFLAGRLDDEEQDLVKAHVSVCAECQTEVRFQRRLGSEIAQLPLDVEQGWTLMRQQIEADARAKPRKTAAAKPRRAAAPGWSWSPPAWLGGFSGGFSGGGALAFPLGGAAMAGAVLAVGVLWLSGPLVKPAADYHALSSGPSASTGNLMVIFKPDTPEHSLREALVASHARLVGGPTEADAYVLFVPGPERDSALNALRARADIVVAQPIDPGSDR